jgi:hypothetical protein
MRFNGLFDIRVAPILSMTLNRDVGSPSTLHTDNAKELTSGGWKKITSEHQIPQTLAEPYSSWQVRAKGAIRELKQGVNHLMESKNAPRLLWDFCAAYVADLRSMTVTDFYSLHKAIHHGKLSQGIHLTSVNTLPLHGTIQCGIMNQWQASQKRESYLPNCLVLHIELVRLCAIISS